MKNPRNFISNYRKVIYKAKYWRAANLLSQSYEKYRQGEHKHSDKALKINSTLEILFPFYASIMLIFNWAVIPINLRIELWLWMDTDVEKVYVAVGNDLQDGLKTLAWTLAKFESQPFSIVILYLTYDISRDLVYTPRKFSSVFCFTWSPVFFVINFFVILISGFIVFSWLQASCNFCQWWGTGRSSEAWRREDWRVTLQV